MHKLTIGVTIKANHERNYNIHQPQPGQANNHRLSGYTKMSLLKLLVTVGILLAIAVHS